MCVLWHIVILRLFYSVVSSYVRTTPPKSLNVNTPYYLVNHFRGIDFYLIEEFFVAALALNKRDWAEFFLLITRSHYPKYAKTMRMLAMFYECQGEILKA